MRVGEEWDDCIVQQGVQYIGGEDPPRASGQGERRPGEAAALGAAPPLTLTLMGCGPAVAAAQTLHIQYSNTPRSLIVRHCARSD
jgi:hypothetical protein